ncbi:MAG: tRNA-binding protein [Gemmatimonadetes bacterium]|nr:tRNA-binding protein [Gemmatimonadota bacterium]
MPTFDQFQEFDIRVGTVVAARPHPTARNPSLQLTIDFGPSGLKRSSARLTRLYQPAALIGQQVVAVLNFPPRRVADFVSEVLVLGAMLPDDVVVLLQPDRAVENGARIA